jgi:NADPH2:quinone reductase
MKALLSTAVGGPETLVLTEIPEPGRPGNDDVLLRVKACAVNYPDVLIIQDKYQMKPPRPFAPGCEVAGIIEAVGASVGNFEPGDRVMAFPGWGGMAEKILVKADRCTAIPAAMPFDVASSLILTYLTTYHGLKHRANLHAGEKLLVLGAAGGAGIAAVQLGKTMGATVIAAASSEEKVSAARRNGADIGLVYPTGNLDKDRAKAMTEALKQLAGDGGMDVIYDPVGGDYAEAALRSIGWEGRYLVIGFPAGIPKIPLNLVLLKGCDILGVHLRGFMDHEPVEAAASIRELIRFCTQGAIKPLISAHFPLERGGEAIATLANREIVGKAIVTMD